MYDISAVRKDFPILGREVYKRPLVYLDNAATTQKPRCVVEAMANEYYTVNANVHRGVHYLSGQATDLHEAARERVRRFIHARKASEVVFTRGTTESINLVAATWGEAFLQAGDEVLLTVMEHHSDIVPWQLLRERKGIVLKVVPMTDSGELDLEAYGALLSPRTKIVCCAHVSNVLGTVNPVERMAAMAHAQGALMLVDAAQSVPHMQVDVQQLGCDFLAFSGHKVYGPTGIGVLYGREELLEQLPPYQGGGEMIGRVTWEHTTFERPPFKFEAGTPDYVGTHGLAAALDYVDALGMEQIHAHEQEITRYAMEQMALIPDMHLYGTAPGKDAVVAFNVGDIHPLDLGTLLDRLGIAIRTGHHCAQPLMERCGVEGMARASFALYTTRQEVDALVEGIDRVRRMF